MKTRTYNPRLIFSLIAVPCLALSSCRTQRPHWTTDQMHSLLHLAAITDGCSATNALFVRDRESPPDIAALPVFVSTFKNMQDAERRHPGHHSTWEERLDMIGHAERLFRGNEEVIQALAELCRDDPSPKVRKLAGMFKEPNKP
jgi:hypothetical protein